MVKLLIADDNKQITSILKEYSEKDGYEAVVAYDGEQALQEFEKGKFDLILLDVMMPKKDGFEVCREIRKVSSVPIIMVTARGEDFERIMGLDIGADDYIVKPFSPGEVMARIRAILRRLDQTPDNQDHHKLYVHEDLEIRLDEFIVKISGQQIHLTKKEIELLWILATNTNKVFSRDNLLDSVWGYDYFGDNRTVDSHIKRLRAKVDQIPHPSWDIKTVWGVGYKFEVSSDEI
ncbi:response regulator transcription factor [uncultured Trichococcus sp.]|uniref:response regulator transcription factor n=1 Tax=uncultured Trichococcus sp. TaxID=189665 RepID=UPI002A1899B7|nr:response regulator transcription factor [uncultured Trichococcus sp.]